jgi:serine/threonine-protein kinase
VLWTFKPDTSIRHLTAYDDVVYVVTEPGILLAARADDAEPLWQRDLQREYVTGIACSCDRDADYLVASTYHGAMALDRKTGDVVWERLIAPGLAGPVVVNKRVYAAGYDGSAYALDLIKGSVLWQHDYLADAPEDPPGFDGQRARIGDRPARPGAASCDGETVFFSAFDQCRAIALDSKTGARRWAFRTEGWMYMQPAISDQQVFVGSQDKHFYCIEKATGKLVWKFKTGSRVEAAAAVTDRHVFFGSCDANLYCLDKATGALQWQYATAKRGKGGGPIYSQPIVSGDTVYLPAMEGQVYALDAASGQLKWQLRPSEDSEIDGSFTDGKRLYIATRPTFEKKGEEAMYVLGK